MADTLYIVRHAMPDYPNGERMCLGQTLDLPLCGLGRRQAEIVGRFLRKAGFDRVVASPLKRSVETARIIAGDRPVEVMPELIELYGGAWDGMRFCDIRSRYPEYFTEPRSGKSVPPNGEDDESGLLRGLKALRAIEKMPEKTVVAVAHSGINRILLAHISGLPMAQKKQIPHPYAAAALLRRTENSWRVETAEMDIRVPQSEEEQCGSLQ